MENKEIEVRFLEVNKEDLVKKITALGGVDHGETMLQEIIFKIPEIPTRSQFVRLRDTTKKLSISYKHHKENTDHKLNHVEEVEVIMNDTFDNTKLFLEKIGLSNERCQQKFRHSLELEGVQIDIDTWPKMPPYVELEGDSEEILKIMADKLGLDWGKVTFENARAVIENIYNIPVGKMKYFTFDKCE